MNKQKYYLDPDEGGPYTIEQLQSDIDNCYPTIDVLLRDCTYLGEYYNASCAWDDYKAKIRERHDLWYEENGELVY